ncbi:PREDICTED: RWD domain-containing protein 1-like [Acropora digitifera]|uniref:RWD domain-containing protein 1-like n=1 Tax=Acropora digitifera TaxID=70779 RepID=UPI000779FAAC|nr:PREDICTED: RWD domain-containing protein 1-like [Acropora digitifera]
MTDHKEEQELELEALTSIYPDEFALIESDPCCFQVSIVCEPDKPGDEDCKGNEIVINDLNPGACFSKVSKMFQLNQTFKHSVFPSLQALENLGMAMVFTLVSAAQEKLNEFMNKLKEDKESDKLRKEKEAEEADRKKFVGTAVTLETFLAWRQTFEQEMMQINKKSKEDNLKGKLTGRQLFEQDEAMENSDAAFLEGEVKVDESLFQELDDLDLDGEDLE